MTLEHAWKAKAVHLQGAVREWERSYELLESVMQHQQEELEKMKRDLDALLDRLDEMTKAMRQKYTVPDLLDSDEADTTAPAQSGEQQVLPLASEEQGQEGVLGKPRSPKRRKADPPASG